MTTEPLRNEPIDEFLKRQFGDKSESRILQDPSAAGRIAHRLSEEPLPEGVAAPITHALPTSLAPVKYIIHVWTHKCSLCNTEHKHSEVYALNHLKSRTGAGTWVRNMTPVSRLEWRVPVDVIPVTTRTTAGCFECLEAIRDEILPSLPLPPVPEALLKGAAGTSADDTGASAPARPLKTPKRVSTDDFLI